MTIDFNFLLDNPGDIVFKNSGGPDCAILMHAAAKFVTENNLDIKFYHVTVDTVNKFFYIKHAKIVIQYLLDTFGIACAEHAISTGVEVTVTMHPDGTSTINGYRESQRKLINDLRTKYPNIKYEICGVTNMLPTDIIVQQKQVDSTYANVESKDRERTSSTVKQEMIRVKEYCYYTPLINLDKRDVKLLYDEYCCLDTLFPLTRSCEMSAESLRYKQVQSGHCGRCLFCVERKIAFGRL